MRARTIPGWEQGYRKLLLKVLPDEATRLTWFWRTDRRASALGQRGDGVNGASGRVPIAAGFPPDAPAARAPGYDGATQAGREWPPADALWA